MSTLDTVWQEFTTKYDRIPVWLPGTTGINLGDIGVIGKRGWAKLYNLKDFGIDVEDAASTGLQTQYELNVGVTSTTAGAASAQTQQALGPVLSAALNLTARFSKKGAFLVRAYDVQGHAIGNLGAVDEAIALRHARDPFWKRRWIYVTEVVTAAPFVMLVSGGRDVGATVAANADATSTGIGSAGVEVRVLNTEGLDQSFATGGRAPFMWRGQWRGRWFSQRMRDLGEEEDLGDIRLGGGISAGTGREDPHAFEDFRSPALYLLDEDAPEPDDQDSD
jgi:hypothetical protein